MTLNDDELDRAIIDALRRAPDEAGAPLAARQRVGVRLAATTGIVGLTSSIAAGAATNAATLTLTALTKTLLVGMALGVTVGGGLHVAFGVGAPKRAEPPRDAPLPRVAVTTVPAAGERWEEPRTVSAAIRGVVPETARRSAQAKTRVNPSPELPDTEPPAMTATAASLAEQQRLLDDGRAALRRGDGSAALDAMERHLERFPQTAFEEEREAVRIRALVLLGRAAEARSRAERFTALFPKSLLLHSIETTLSPTKTPDAAVTESRATSQSSSKQ